MNQQVTEYIEKLNQKWQADISRQLREVVNQAIPSVEERIQYGKPHFLKNGKYAAVLGVAKGWVSFTIFNGQALNPPAGLFETSENGERKTIKITEGQVVNYELLSDLVTQAARGL